MVLKYIVTRHDIFIVYKAFCFFFKYTRYLCCILENDPQLELRCLAVPEQISLAVFVISTAHTV